MKIYIAGPITGVENYKEAFNTMESELLRKGHAVMNPSILPEGFEHHEYMRICYSMIDVCDAVFMLNNWEDSKGASLEFLYANKNDKLVIIES